MIQLDQVLRTTMIAGVLERTASAAGVRRRYPNITRAEVELVRQRLIAAASQKSWASFVAFGMDYALPGLGTAARFLNRRR